MSTTAVSEPAAEPAENVVILTVPASPAYLSLLRTATAALAARMQFALDEIEDLRIAVDEACALLLRIAIPNGDLVCGFALGDDGLSVIVEMPVDDGADLPRMPALSWQVLTSLATDVSTEIYMGRAILRFRKMRTG